jgi:hypothetical protein
MFIRETAPAMQRRLSRDAIQAMDLSSFREALRHVNAFRMHARQVRNAEFGLPADHKESVDARVDRLCELLWRARSPRRKTVRDVLEYVLWPSEVYDAATGFALTGAPKLPRQDHVSAVLTDGRVLLVGGADASNTDVLPCEIFDPATNSFSLAAPLAIGRRSPIVTPLPSGTVLIAGGTDSTGTMLTSAEIFTP